MEHSLTFEVLVDELIEMCIRVAILDTVTCSKLVYPILTEHAHMYHVS